MPMFITALFTIAIMWKQSKCPSIDECTDKMWSIHKMEYYSTDHHKDLGLDSGMGVMWGKGVELGSNTI